MVTSSVITYVATASSCASCLHTRTHAQVLKLRSLLRERGLGAINVGQCEDYQGQEAKVRACGVHHMCLAWHG
jgi:hypothetical protein